MLEYSRVTKVLAPWLNFIVQLASSQPPLMVLKAEILSQETEPSNFYSLPLIQTEEDMQSGKFEAFLSHHSVWGCQDFCYTTVLEYCTTSRGHLATAKLAKIPVDLTQLATYEARCKVKLEKVNKIERYHISYVITSIITFSITSNKLKVLNILSWW